MSKLIILKNPPNKTNTSNPNFLYTSSFWMSTTLKTEILARVILNTMSGANDYNKFLKDRYGLMVSN